MNWPDFCVFWRHINPCSVCSEFHLSRVYYKNKTLCLNNRFKKDAITLERLIRAMKKLYSNKKFTFIQDRAPSHRGKIIQNFLRVEFKSRVANTGWLPSSLNGNLLGYYFWNKVKEKLYIVRDAEHFESEKKLKDRIFSVHDQCATNVEPLCKARKQFWPRLKDVVTKEQRPVKAVFN